MFQSRCATWAPRLEHLVLAMGLLTATGTVRAQAVIGSSTYINAPTYVSHSPRGSFGLLAVADDGSTYFSANGFEPAFAIGVKHLSANGQAVHFAAAVTRGDAFDLLLTSSTVVVVGRTGHDELPIIGGFQTELGQDPLSPSIYLSTTGDAYVARLDATDGSLAYSTFLGGSELDRAHAVTEAPDGGLIVVGTTWSLDFPVVDAHQAELAGDSDAFVARIAPDGASLVFSTYLGGTARDELTGVVIGNDGSLWVVGRTWSPDFPTLGPQLESDLSSCEPGAGCHADLFLAQLSATGELQHSTLFGGSDTDSAWDLAVTDAGDLLFVGETYSSDFPVVNALQAVAPSERSGHVSKFSPATGTLVYSTYLGGPIEPSDPPPFAGNGAYAVTTDDMGRAIVAGDTSSAELATPLGFQTELAGGESDAFLWVLSPDGSTLLLGSYLGGGTPTPCDGIPPCEFRASDQAWSVELGPGSVVHLGGITRSIDFPVVDPLEPEMELPDLHFPFPTTHGTAFVTRILTDPETPLEPNGLRLSLSDRSIVVGWDETMGDPRYALHVGNLASLLQTRTHGHFRQEPCEVDAPPFVIDLDDLPFESSYFLVTAVKGGNESSYGRTSLGLERPSSSLEGSACP